MISFQRFFLSFFVYFFDSNEIENVLNILFQSFIGWVGCIINEIS